MGCLPRASLAAAPVPLRAAPLLVAPLAVAEAG